MRAVLRTVLLLAAVACSACSKQPAQTPVANNSASSGMDIETLPPDDSDTTPTNELENGADEPGGNMVDLNSD